jgi:predicted CXXCH cytochrome family protein
MSCSTCHDETCYLPRSAANPAFLRGGPYLSENEFCFRCHADDRTETLNPHDQFHSVGLLKVDTCLTCHTSVPEREEQAGASHELIDEVVFLCQRCHAEEKPHPSVNHLVKIPRDMSKMKTAYEEKHKVLLPLGKGALIVCTTCHNPHDKGVLKGEKGVGAGEIDLLRLPDFNENCAPCHGDHR